MSINIGGLVLFKLLSDPNNTQTLEAWSKIKLSFFGAEYIAIYSAIDNFYIKFGSLPSFSDLDISLRESLLKNNIKALQTLNAPDVSMELVVDALINEYTQTETLKQIDIFVDNVTLLDTEEIKQELANISLLLEERTHTSEKICLMNDITIIDDAEIETTLVSLGINNTFDSEFRCYTSELILLGGKRGSGKSIVSNNVFVNQYEQGNSCVYFSIEMPKRDIFNRTMSMLSGVNFTKIRNNDLDQYDYDSLAIARKEMFIDTDDIYNKYLEDKNYRQFEKDLISKKILKPDNQLVIIDNQRLTLADIDLNVQKFKNQFKDKLKLVIVDYVNQIEINDIYNWQQQIILAKQLKVFARKYDVVMLSPYQIDATGEARFSKGLLDAPDIAMILKAEKDHIKLVSSKTRSTSVFELASPIDWSILRMDPRDYIEDDNNNEKEDTSNEDVF